MWIINGERLLWLNYARANRRRADGDVFGWTRDSVCVGKNGLFKDSMWFPIVVKFYICWNCVDGIPHSHSRSMSCHSSMLLIDQWYRTWICFYLFAWIQFAINFDIWIHQSVCCTLFVLVNHKIHSNKFDCIVMTFIEISMPTGNRSL